MVDTMYCSKWDPSGMGPTVRGRTQGRMDPRVQSAGECVQVADWQQTVQHGVRQSRVEVSRSRIGVFTVCSARFKQNFKNTSARTPQHSFSWPKD